MISIFVSSLLCMATSVWTTEFTHQCAIVPLADACTQNSQISYQKCSDAMRLSFLPFPFTQEESWYESNPLIPEVFIVRIKDGCLFSNNGYVYSHGLMIKELLWDWSPLRKQPTIHIPPEMNKPERRSVKVAVLAQEGHENYYHWMLEVLPKLALLEKENISFDLVYVPYHLPFMQQTLALWGITEDRIIHAGQQHIQANELIVPSAVSRSCYTPSWVVNALRNKYLPFIASTPNKSFSKKVFISRKKASYRRIENEDEVFNLFKPYGFKRYFLEDMPFLEQISLFHYADAIVAPHGAGLSNILFCNPETLIIELFQEHQDEAFWFLGQTVGIQKYICVKTTDFKKGGGYTNTTIPLDTIRTVISGHLKE